MLQIIKSLRPLFLLNALLFCGSISAQTISPRYFSQNAWMPDTIGNANACIDPPCVLYGQLHSKWSKIGESGANTVRFGGIQADRNMPTNYQYIKMIDSIRAKGMEPIIQVPFYNWRYSATQAAAIVQYINITKGKNIKYWIIGNEPDHVYGYTTASQVASYIRPFASAMKAVDPSIKIIGPETAWFNANIINGLTTAGGPDDITGVDGAGRYYVDIISFHCYAFNGSQSRSAMISNLGSTGGMDANLVYLNGRLNSCNSSHGRTGLNALTSAITEGNVNWQNSTTDNLNGTGVNSFIGGQFIAEMFGVGLKNNVDFINMWSVVEGNNTALNIGYLDNVTGNKKPAYHHFQMMSSNFSGNYIPSVSTSTNVKVFSCNDSGITTVMIMNQELTNSLNFTLRLNTDTASGTNALKINVNANIAQEYNDVIANESTLLLQFNSQGAIVKKIVYSLASHALANLPPSITNFTYALTPPANTTPLANLTRCSGKTATLTAVSGTNNITWFASATSTSAISSGSVLVTPSLSASGNSTTVVFYAQAANNLISSTRTPVTVTVHPRPTIVLSSGTICAGNSFTIIPSGANSYSYSGGSSIVSPVTTTAYYASGTSTAGCTSTLSGVSNVVVNARPVIAVNSGSICAGSSFVMVPSGAASYSFTGNSATVSPVVSTSYSVTGVSAQGCSSGTAAIASVNVFTAPVIAVNSGTICAGDIFTIMPSGASSYIYSGGSPTVSPTANTSYSVTGTNNNGCISAVIVSISVYSRPVVSVNSGSICPGNSFVLNPTGATSYTFSSGSATVIPTSNSTYSVMGSSAQGCVSNNAAIANVYISQVPVVTVNSGSICAGQVFTFTPSGALTYTFSNGSTTVNPSSNASYSVTGTNAAGCLSAPAVATLSVHARPVVSVNSGSICPGAGFVIVPSGASSYVFSSGSATVNPSVTSVYSVTGISNVGCVSASMATATVNVFSAPLVAMNGGSICYGQSFTLAPTGAVSYTFTNGSMIVSPTVSTSYSVTGSNASGCVSSAIAQVIVNARPVITVNSGSICSGSSFTITPSGASTYSVINGGLVVSPMTNSSFLVSGTSAAGCVSSQMALCTVTVFTTPVTAVTSGTICRGGVFTMVPSGATSYIFSNGSATVAPAVTTSYTVTGSSSGCSSTAIAVITVLAGKNAKGCGTGTTREYVTFAPGVDSNSITLTADPSIISTDEQNATTAIVENSTASIMKIYPNPNQGEFKIETDRDGVLTLIDVAGNILRNISISAGSTALNISELPSGIYIVRITQGSNVKYARVLKQ